MVKRQRPGRTGVQIEDAVLALQVRPVGVAADHRLEPGRGGVQVQEIQVMQDVELHPAHLHHPGLREFAGPAVLVDAAPPSTAATCRPPSRAKNADGRGPAWSNSLFEDNAEFGMGYRASIDKQAEFARELVHELAPNVGVDLAASILGAGPEERGGNL